MSGLRTSSFRLQLAVRFTLAMAVALAAVTSVGYLALRETLDRQIEATILSVASIQAASVTDDPADLAELGPLLAEDWSPEALAVGSRAAYLWCSGGVHKSPLSKAVGEVLGDRVTARNWKTTLKIQALLGDG